MEDDDLFDIVVGEVKRDRWDRPLIIQPDCTCPPESHQCELPYMRTSTLAGKAGGGVGLSIWKGRHIALAVAAHEDVAAVVRGLEYGDAKLDKFIEDALERAKMSEPANWGTAVHLFTEPEVKRRGTPAPDRIKQEVLSYEDALEACGIEVVETELFVVNDELQVAGTFDHLYYLPVGMPLPDWHRHRYVPAGGLVVVGDKKTGKPHPLQVMVQEATYATSVRYDAETGERGPLWPPPPERQTDATYGGAEFDPSLGLSVHIPLGAGRTEFGFVDLSTGYTLACNIRWLSDLERMEKRGQLVTPVPVRADWSAIKTARVEAAAGEVREAVEASRSAVTALRESLSGRVPTVLDQAATSLTALKPDGTIREILGEAVPDWSDRPTVEISDPPQSPSDLWRSRIDNAEVRSELSRIWREASTAGQWTRELEEYGKKKLASIQA